MADRTTPGYAGFARLYWMFLGPMLLLLTAIAVANDGGGGWIAPKSLAFLGLLALMLACRWAEFHAGDARTAEGEPATPAHLRRYLIVAALIGSAVWIAANFVAANRTGT
jgi:hypothetical protein